MHHKKSSDRSSESFDDTPPRSAKAKRSASSFREGTEDRSYLGDSDDFYDEFSKDTSDGSHTSTFSRQGQIYMIVAATVVASCFLGVVMKFAFSPGGHSGHAHAVRKIDRRVLIAPDPEDQPLADSEELLSSPVANSTTWTTTESQFRRASFTYECRTDACLWQSRLVYDKMNQSTGPCDDFHGYICSNRWYIPDLDVQSRPYTVSAPGLLILDIAKYLLQYNNKSEGGPAFIQQSALFLQNCIQQRNLSKNATDWTSIQRIFASYSLSDWPYLSDPAMTKFLDVLKLVDKNLTLFPIVGVSLRKRFENEGYMLHLDAPRLTLVRHQMTYLDEGFQEYKNCIKRAFSLFGTTIETDHIAEDVLELERKLDEASVPPRKFVSILNSTESIINLKRVGKLEWESYLPYLLPGSEKTIVLNSAFLTKLSGILTSTSLSTLLNYLGFRILVLLSPFLPKEAEFLIPLSYDHHIPKYNARLQACVHLTERLFPHGIRKIARLSMGKTSLEQVLYDHNLENLVSTVKGAMMQTVAHAPWLTQGEADIATQKIQSLEVELIGAKEHMDTISRYYDIKTKASFTMDTALQDFVAVLLESSARYWRSKDNAEYDARYHTSSLRPGFEYNAGRNSLYIPYGVVAFQNRVSQSTVPAILLPFILPYVVQGMYEAVDVRGSTMNVRGMPETWWSAESLVRYRKQQRCFVDGYLRNLQTFGAFQVSPLKSFNFIHKRQGTSVSAPVLVIAR